MTFRSDATEGVWSPTQNVAVQTEANVVAIFFFHQCGFSDPTHHIRGCQKIIWNFALKGRALANMTRVTILRWGGGGGGGLPGTAAPIVVLFLISVSSSVWGSPRGPCGSSWLDPLMET